MKTFPRYTAAVVAALAIAGAFGVAKANPMGGPTAQMCGDMDARMTGHMAYTEAKLGLTETQKAEFKTLTETMKAANAPMRQACTAQTAETKLPARMEAMQKMMTARAEAMAKIQPALAKFYASLTPEQQKIADTSLMGGGRHGGMGYGMGHMSH